MQPCPPKWYFFNEGGGPISTFIPSVVSLVKEIISTGEREAVKVRLRFKNGSSTEVTVPLSDLDHVDWFTKDHRCIVNSKYRQAKRFIADTIRAGISNAPIETKYVLDRTGIHRFNNNIIFAAGDQVITRSPATEDPLNFELGSTQFHLDFDENITPKTAFEGMRELISLSPEIGPVLVAHAISGIIRTAFKEAGITPCAVLVIVGESGLLKSHYVPHLVVYPK